MNIFASFNGASTSHIAYTLGFACIVASVVGFLTKKGLRGFFLGGLGAALATWFSMKTAQGDMVGLDQLIWPILFGIIGGILGMLAGFIGKSRQRHVQ